MYLVSQHHVTKIAVKFVIFFLTNNFIFLFLHCNCFFLYKDLKIYEDSYLKKNLNNKYC